MRLITKSLTIRFITLLLLVICLPANAQRIVKLLEGSMKPLREVDNFAITFTYDSMLVGRDVSEETYLANKRHALNAKMQGKGDKYYKRWFEGRTTLYEPSFKQSFRVYAKINVDATNAKYTIVVKTRRVEPGWDGGPIVQAGKLDGEVWIVETADTTKVIAKFGFYGLLGDKTDGDDMEAVERIQSAYLMSGKQIGEWWAKRTGRQ